MSLKKMIWLAEEEPSFCRFLQSRLFYVVTEAKSGCPRQCYAKAGCLEERATLAFD